MINLALRIANIPKPAVRLNELAVGMIAVVAALLPGMGDYNLSFLYMFVWGNADLFVLLRVVLLTISFGLIGVTSYRRAPDGGASSVAIVWGAALGWCGWGWSYGTSGWVIFAALVLLIDRDTARNDCIAAILVVGWALLSEYAIWGTLLVLLYALQRWRARPLSLFAGGIIAVVVAWLRGFEPWAVLFPAARPWIWADGQATNKFSDPIGIALFGSMLIFVALHHFRRGQTHLNLLPLAVFALFTWQARRNGIWLGFVAAPVFASLLADLEPRFQRWASPSIAIASMVLLVLAIIHPPIMFAGRSLSQYILNATKEGTIIYRPTFGPALNQKHFDFELPLINSNDPQAIFNAWTRIAANCAPAAELDQLGATIVVLDTTLDRAPIASLAADQRWRQAASDDIATVFVRVEGLP